MTMMSIIWRLCPCLWVTNTIFFLKWLHYVQRTIQNSSSVEHAFNLGRNELGLSCSNTNVELAGRRKSSNNVEYEWGQGGLLLCTCFTLLTGKQHTLLQLELDTGSRKLSFVFLFHNNNNKYYITAYSFKLYEKETSQFLIFLCISLLHVYNCYFC